MEKLDYKKIGEDLKKGKLIIYPTDTVYGVYFEVTFIKGFSEMKVINKMEKLDYKKIGEDLKKGKLIIYPTDTVYGVGGIITNEETIKNIYKAKDRSFSSPLIALVSSAEKIGDIAFINEKNREKIEKLMKTFWPGGLTIILESKDIVPPIMISNGKTVGVIAFINEKNREKIEKLMKTFWPGGLTIILESKDIVPPIMISNGKTVGVRMPDHETALKIIESAGGILPTTSANISGEATPRSYDELDEEFKKRVDRMPDHETALKIIESAGGILPTTSANISGEATPRSYDELDEEFKKRVDIIVDGGKCPIGTASIFQEKQRLVLMMNLMKNLKRE